MKWKFEEPLDGKLEGEVEVEADKHKQAVGKQNAEIHPNVDVKCKQAKTCTNARDCCCLPDSCQVVRSPVGCSNFLLNFFRIRSIRFQQPAMQRVA
ncbi:hypothetical protein WR25_00452 [Diploscapter pachys]|uniref:Uncharacterized protein n=1 Tax=Diploscapter pachys TaxID=2018661 RepID=A0A2A2K076_9BILA|nr:hypothetical protein WR25_00452 [Diploscapter pachys]